MIQKIRDLPAPNEPVWEIATLSLIRDSGASRNILH